MNLFACRFIYFSNLNTISDPERIGIIVIDECTAAVKRYPYADFFRSIFRPDGGSNGGFSKRPKILALTSSLLTEEVVSDPKVLETVISNMEESFFSRLKTSVSLVSIDRFGYAKDIRVIPYSVRAALFFRQEIQFNYFF